MIEENLTNKCEEKIIEMFIPITMTRRGGTTMVIVPKNAATKLMMQSALTIQ